MRVTEKDPSASVCHLGEQLIVEPLKLRFAHVGERTRRQLRIRRGAVDRSNDIGCRRSARRRGGLLRRSAAGSGLAAGGVAGAFAVG
jgi:hypothetical protein